MCKDLRDNGKKRRTRLYLFITVLTLCIPFTFASSRSTALPEQIVFGGDANYPPFEWKKKGTPQGFNIDLAKSIAKAGGLSGVHRLASWPDTIKALKAGHVDIVPMFASERRSRDFIFTKPFYYVSHSLYADGDAPSVSSLEALNGSRVAVEELSFAHDRLQNDFPKIKTILNKNTHEALKSVIAGTADYALVATPSAGYFIREEGFPLRQTSPPFWSRPYVFAVSKANPEIAEWLFHSLDLALSNGSYETIHEKWEASLTASGDLPAHLQYAGYLFAAFVIIILFSFIWTLALRKVVSKQTTRLRQELKQRRQAESKAQYLANHHEQSGVPRLHHFLKVVDSILGRADVESDGLYLSVLKIMDHDEIVASFGHGIGDQVSIDFANRLKSQRYLAVGSIGRDRFCLLINASRLEGLLDAIASDLGPADLNLRPLVIGGSVECNKNESAADLLRKAETALATAAERRTIWEDYHPSMEPNKNNLQIISDFKRNQGRNLFCVFQPKLELRTNKIIGAEALIRWKHPVEGLVPPARFIPLLEKAGLTSIVTEKVVRKSALFAAKLNRAGLPCPISVNVSPRDFITMNLVATVEDSLKQAKGKFSDLKLELTETSLAEYPDLISSILKALSDKGLKSSIDDFGTGYSSLSYLANFPISEIKIDRVFIKDIQTNERHLTIVRSTISLAHALGFQVVAEGVEDHEIIDLLRREDCDIVQGYGIAKPLTEAEFIDFIESYTQKFSAHRTLRV